MCLRVCICVVSVEMVVNTKLEVQSIDNVVATIYGRKDSGLYASLSLLRSSVILMDDNKK